MRQQILDEIRRLAERDGRPPGRSLFTRETGIAPHRWAGVIWARWGEALAEAGFKPNQLAKKRDSNSLLAKVAEACRYFGRFPANAEMRLYRRDHLDFPSRAGIPSHFASNAELLSALTKWCGENPTYGDVLAMLPAAASRPKASTEQGVGTRDEGAVYLIKSGAHYKIGRSDEIERRFKEIRPALPEKATIVHFIKTDDPPGIEAYWHRRFEDRRANGEWFKLSAADVAAFRRRKSQ